MKKYYVIKVYSYQEGSKAYVFDGYYTGNYKVDKGAFCGADKNVNYDHVTKYSTEDSVNAAKRKLEEQEWGNEKVIPTYNFEIEVIETELKERYKKHISSKQNREAAKIIIKQGFPYIMDAFDEYIKNEKIDEVNAEDIQEIIISKLCKIL